MNKVNMIFFFLESTVVSPEEKAKENERKDYAAQWYVVTFMKKPFDGNGKCFMKSPRSLSKFGAGVEKMANHGTNGPRNFFMSPERMKGRKEKGINTEK